MCKNLTQTEQWALDAILETQDCGRVKLDTKLCLGQSSKAYPANLNVSFLLFLQFDIKNDMVAKLKVGCKYVK